MSGWYGSWMLFDNFEVDLVAGRNDNVSVLSIVNSVVPAANGDTITGFKPPVGVEDQFGMFVIANADLSGTKSFTIKANDPNSDAGYRFLGPTDYTLAPLQSEFFAYSPGVGFFVQAGGTFA